MLQGKMFDDRCRYRHVRSVRTRSEHGCLNWGLAALAAAAKRHRTNP
jgi:hypothetical protein